MNWRQWLGLDHAPVPVGSDARLLDEAHAKEREAAEAALQVLRQRLLHLEAEVLDSHEKKAARP